MTDRELLELIFTEITGLKAGQERLEGEMTGLKAGQERLEARQERLEDIVIRIENNHGRKLEALFDGWKQNTEQLKRHGEILERIESKLEKHEVEIKVIKGSKNISMW